MEKRESADPEHVTYTAAKRYSRRKPRTVRSHGLSSVSGRICAHGVPLSGSAGQEEWRFMDSNGELFTNRAAVFEQIGRIREVPRGTLLSGSDAYWLKKGVCALTCVNAGGKEYSFLYFEEGMLFGFVPVLERYYAINGMGRVNSSKFFSGFLTKTDCVIVDIPAQIFLKQVRSNPQIRSAVMRAATLNLVNMLTHSMVLSALPVAARVCYLLLEFAPEKPPYVLPQFLSYDEIATHLDMHVITVTKIFRALFANGILEKKGRQRVVVDPDRLLAIVNLEQELEYAGK